MKGFQSVHSLLFVFWNPPWRRRYLCPVKSCRVSNTLRVCPVKACRLSITSRVCPVKACRLCTGNERVYINLFYKTQHINLFIKKISIFNDGFGNFSLRGYSNLRIKWFFFLASIHTCNLPLKDIRVSIHKFYSECNRSPYFANFMKTWNKEQRVDITILQLEL